MKILIISHATPPHASIGSLRIFKLSKYLKENGHDIKILTTSKYKFDGVQDNIQDMHGIEIIEVAYAPFKYFKRFKAKTINPVKKEQNQKIISIKSEDSLVEKIKLQVRKFRKTIGSLFDIHDLWIYAARKKGLTLYDNWKYDIVISSFGPPAPHIVASGLKKKHKKLFWIADFRDLWSQNFNSPAKFPFSFIEKYIENQSVKYADFLTTVSEAPREKLLKLFPEKEVETIYNGYDTFRGHLQKKENSNLIIIYTGTVYAKQDPSKLFKAISQLNSPRKIEVNFYGSINETTQKLINKYDFVNFFGKKPREEILKLQEEADILLLLEWMDPTQQGVLTGKLFEYLELKKPILCVGDYKNTPTEVIEKIGIGKFCSTNQEIASFIENFNKYTANEKELYEYSFKKQVEKLEKIFDKNFK